MIALKVGANSLHMPFIYFEESILKNFTEIHNLRHIHKQTKPNEKCNIHTVLDKTAVLTLPHQSSAYKKFLQEPYISRIFGTISNNI